MNPLRRAILVLACTAATIVSAAEFSIRSWDTDDGLPSSSVLALAQTPDGYLWLGTLRGLVRFDGLNFKVYDPANTPALTDGRILTLFADSTGTLWIGTESAGILTMRDGIFTAPKELVDRRLVSACEESAGIVWLLNANGELWRYDGHRYSPYFVNPNDPTIGAPRSVIKEIGGPVWVGTQFRHAAIAPNASSGGGIEAPVVESFPAALGVDQLIAGRNRGYWRLGNNQVQYWLSNRVESVVSAGYPWQAGGARLSSSEDLEGNLFVGTQGAGVFRFSLDGRPTSTLSTNDGLSHSFVLSLLVDREGTLWVGTDGGGLNRVTRKMFHTIPETRNWVVPSVAAAQDGKVWIIGNGRANSVTWWSNGTYHAIENTRWFVRSVLVDTNDGVWVGTPFNGLLRNDRERFYQAGVPNVQAIFQDRSQKLWFGAEHGLHRLSAGEWKVFSTAHGLAADAITAIGQDQSGSIWVGTRRNGLSRSVGDQFAPLPRSDGAPQDIAALIIDEADVLWVTTFDYGLFRNAGGKWTRYSEREGLVSNSLGYLIEGPDDSLWIGSNRGVLRVWKRQLNEVAAGTRGVIQCRAYSTPEGLPTSECTSGSQPGATRDTKGRLWFPTIRGVAWVDPAELTPNTNPPPVSIDSVLVDHESIGPSRHITLQPSAERIEIHYTSLNFRAPEKALFRYILEGHETDWTEAGAVRVARYSKLPPGDYTFRVTACNEDGVWNETGSALGLVVQPPIWRTWWFIMAVVVAVIGGVAGAVYLVSAQRYGRQLAVLRQQEALERERARIARDIHDQVGASLTQVALLGELVEADKNSPPDVESHAQQISQTARETTRALDEIVWTVNPSNDTLEGLVNYICKYAQDYLGVAGIKYRLDVPSEVPAATIAPDFRHNVFLAAKEAITNVVRHAHAGSAWVRVRLGQNSFTVEIEDNGRGLTNMDPERAKTRHGLSNMRKRMEEVGGSFALEGGAEGGALVRLTVPLKEQNVVT